MSQAMQAQETVPEAGRQEVLCLRTGLRALAWQRALAVLAAVAALPGCLERQRPPPREEPFRESAEPGPGGGSVAQAIGDGAREVFLPNVTGEMLEADFWIARMEDPGAVRMTSEEVAAYSRLVLETSQGALQDLAAFPDSLSRTELAKRALSWSPGDRPLFRDGVEVPREELDEVALNRNEAGMHDANPVRLGTTWQRCNLRMWPTEKPAYETADDHHFDMFQATALDPAEPLVVLHESLDGRWYFVRAYNCDGWLLREQVALVPDRAEWLSLVAPERYLVVTGSRLVLRPDCGSETLAGTVFSMGARLPLSAGDSQAANGSQAGSSEHAVHLPERTTDGTARLVPVVVPPGLDVHVGYLPFTRGNVVRQAFRMLGHPYGWGGLDGGVDCSAFIAGIYRTTGLVLPRNSGRQELVPGRSFLLHAGGSSDVPPSPTTCKSLRTAASSPATILLRPSGFEGQVDHRPSTISAGPPMPESCLDLVPPGASLFLKGHTLIYLGNVDGRDYAIHAMSAYLSDGQKVPVFAVVVSDLSLVRTSGVTLLDSLTSAVDLTQGGKGP